MKSQNTGNTKKAGYFIASSGVGIDIPSSNASKPTKVNNGQPKMLLGSISQGKGNPSTNRTSSEIQPEALRNPQFEVTRPEDQSSSTVSF